MNYYTPATLDSCFNLRQFTRQATRLLQDYDALLESFSITADLATQQQLVELQAQLTLLIEQCNRVVDPWQIRQRSLIAAQYQPQELGLFMDGWAAMQYVKDGQLVWSFVDVNGALLTDPATGQPWRCDRAQNFVDGLALVALGAGNFCFLKTDGSRLTDPATGQVLLFSNARSFSDGIAFVTAVDGWGRLLKTDGRVLKYADTDGQGAGTAVRIDTETTFHDGLAPILNDDTYSFLTRTGDWLTMPVDAPASLAAVVVDGLQPGQPLKFFRTTVFSEGFAPIQGKDLIWYFLTPQAELLTDPETHQPVHFTSVGSFFNGRARVKTSEDYAFLMPDGHLLTQPDSQQVTYYSQARDFVDGVSIVQIKNTQEWRMITPSGRVLSNPATEQPWSLTIPPKQQNGFLLIQDPTDMREYIAINRFGKPLIDDTRAVSWYLQSHDKQPLRSPGFLRAYEVLVDGRIKKFLINAFAERIPDESALA